ncbi:CoA-binding protein [Natronorubrum aibiense]|uniref:CoA-binding protein n=1 Tax=Natronorubrum aibiense TaxID=348826 RepID=A0A5P9P916_9EURY|nr:CoA-binding protein [Natronorubrum aibiense]QFU84604.1 CoA-binding protein [Natronorubrum aibiense]
MPIETDAEVRTVLEQNTVAVVGCSSTPGKAAHEIPKYLDAQGYEVIPVNPNADELLGRPAYDSLSDVEEDIDIVDVFRPSDEVAGIVDAALERDDVEVIWLQLGIHDDEAVARAEAAGLTVVEDRCMKPEHQRLVASAYHSNN